MSSIDKYDGCQIGLSTIWARVSEKKSLARREGKTSVSDDILSPYCLYRLMATSVRNVCCIMSQFCYEVSKIKLFTEWKKGKFMKIFCGLIERLHTRLCNAYYALILLGRKFHKEVVYGVNAHTVVTNFVM